MEINGQLISTGANWLNHLYQALFDVKAGTDATNRRSLLQNAAKGIVPTANCNAQQFMIQNWLGFISSAHPGILDTSLVMSDYELLKLVQMLLFNHQLVLEQHLILQTFFHGRCC